MISICEMDEWMKEEMVHTGFHFPSPPVPERHHHSQMAGLSFLDLGLECIVMSTFVY